MDVPFTCCENGRSGSRCFARKTRGDACLSPTLEGARLLGGCLSSGAAWRGAPRARAVLEVLAPPVLPQLHDVARGASALRSLGALGWSQEPHDGWAVTLMRRGECPAKWGRRAAGAEARCNLHFRCPLCREPENRRAMTLESRERCLLRNLRAERAGLRGNVVNRLPRWLTALVNRSRPLSPQNG